MARALDNSLTSHLTTDTFTLITAYPFTMSCWFYPTDSTGDQGVIFLGRSTSNLNFFYVRLAGSELGERCSLLLNNGGSTPVEEVGVDTTMNAWNHCCVRCLSATSRQLIINGDIANASNDLDVSITFPASLNRFTLGRRHNGGSGGLNYGGRVAWASVHNVYMTDGEVTALANGTNPARVRPSALRGLWPIDGLISPERDLTQHANRLTITGTAPRANDPPVTPFNKRLWGFHSVTAISGSTYTQSLSGAMTPASALVNQPFMSLSDTVAPISGVSNQALTYLSGTLGLVSSITATKVALVVQLTLASSLSLTSTIQKMSFRTLASTIAPVSTLSKLARKSFSGTITQASSIATLKLALIYLIVLSSTIALTSTIQKRTLKSLSGAFAPMSSISKRVSKTFTGAIAPISTIAPIKVFAVISSGFVSMVMWFIRRRRH